jgi:hypothetical protein
VWPTKKFVTAIKTAAKHCLPLTSRDLPRPGCGLWSDVRVGLTFRVWLRTARIWQRFDRKELEACWAAIATLDIADKMTLLRELATEIALAGAKRRNVYQTVVAAVISLRTAAEVLGRSPTQYEYRRLAAELPELDLVPDGTLRRWLGGNWNQCLARALLDSVSEGDFVTLCEGDLFSQQELVEAIRVYMAEHGRIPTFSQLMIWTHTPSVRARPGWRPLSNAPFVRFGGYPAVLERSGIVSKDARRFDHADIGQGHHGHPGDANDAARPQTAACSTGPLLHEEGPLVKWTESCLRAARPSSRCVNAAHFSIAP